MDDSNQQNKAYKNQRNLQNFSYNKLIMNKLSILILSLEFEYDGLRYIDTARVEPKIGYSPEKTPPKTPETPHFTQKPFTVPGVSVGIIPTTMTPSPLPDASSPTSASGPIATSEPKRESFHLEELEGSPGSTLRTRRLREDLDETVQMLQESPGSKNRRRTQESQQVRNKKCFFKKIYVNQAKMFCSLSFNMDVFGKDS